MIIITDDEDRCSDLEIMLTKLNEIKDECTSEDVLEDIDSLISKYIKEYEELDNKLQEEYKQEIQERNNEYIKSVWVD